MSWSKSVRSIVIIFQCFLPLSAKGASRPQEGCKASRLYDLVSQLRLGGIVPQKVPEIDMSVEQQGNAQDEGRSDHCGTNRRSDLHLGISPA